MPKSPVDALLLTTDCPSLGSGRALPLTFFGILIKPLPSFPAQMPGCNHLPPQRRGAVLIVAQPFLQYVENRQADIEADEIRERQGTHWVRHPELHDGVDGFRR